MLRRRIFSYAVMLVAGITGSYLIFERTEIFAGCCVTLTAALIVRGFKLDCRAEDVLKERYILLSFIIVGFMAFSVAFIGMNCSVYNEVTEKKAETGDVIRIEGRICKVEIKSDGYRITIRPESLRGARLIQSTYYTDDIAEEDAYDLLGAEITLHGELRNPSGRENPGCFDYRLYLCSKGIRFTVACKRLKTEKNTDGLYWEYKKNLMRIRDSFLSQFDCDEKIRGFIKGVIFGDKSELDEDIQDDFMSNSTGHILAVSGLHVGFLFSLLRALSRKRRSKGITCIILSVVFLYGEMTMWSASTIRAVIVLTISLLQVYAGRPADLLCSISTAAILLLLINPYYLFAAGFQMSFAAMLGICFFSIPAKHIFGEFFSTVLAVQLAVTPLIIFYYNSFNVVAFMINIPVVFMASVLVPAAMTGLAMSAVAGQTPALFVKMTEGLAEITIKLNELLAFNGRMSFDVYGINAGLLVGLYLLLFLLSSEWVRVYILRGKTAVIGKAVVLLMIPVCLLVTATYNQFLNDEVVFVSTGQGDCVHIRADKHNLLIDGGGNKYFNVGKNTLKPYLLKNRVGDIDMALVTHMHTDHYKGIQELEEVFPVASVGIPLDEADNEDGIPLAGGDRIVVNDEVYIQAIWPIEGHRKKSTSGDENENCTIYMIHYGSIRIMVTGDIPADDELEMVRYYRGTDILKCDVLKIAHHGSKNSTCNEFLDAADPVIAVICVGAYNSYGHPHIETLDRLTEREITTYRTDINGAVGLDIDEREISVDVMRNISDLN